MMKCYGTCKYDRLPLGINICSEHINCARGAIHNAEASRTCVTCINWSRIAISDDIAVGSICDNRRGGICGCGAGWQAIWNGSGGISCSLRFDERYIRVIASRVNNGKCGVESGAKREAVSASANKDDVIANYVAGVLN